MITHKSVGLIENLGIYVNIEYKVSFYIFFL